VYPNPVKGRLLFDIDPHLFKRAKTRQSKRSKIRKPVRLTIDGECCIFVSREWERERKVGLDYYHRYYRDIPWLYREEMKRFPERVRQEIVKIS